MAVRAKCRIGALVKAMKDEIKKERLLRFLERKEPAWLDKDHPDLIAGTEEWVRNLRTESDELRALPDTHDKSS